MWYTFPSDKDEQKKCLDILNEKLQEISWDDKVDFRDDLEELAAFYTGEKPFDAVSAYDKLYHIYSELEIDKGKTKEELFGTDNSIEAFKKNFIEAWRRFSYMSLTIGPTFIRSEDRDKLLEVYEQLHANKKMTDDEIKETALKIDILVTDYQNEDLQNNILAVEDRFENSRNANDITLAIMNREFSKDHYIQNRLQLLRQFANGEATDIKTYMPFYERPENIKSGKEASSEDVKKTAENMKNDSLNELRNKVITVWDKYWEEEDPIEIELNDISKSNDSTLDDSMSSIKSSLSAEKEGKAKFLEKLEKSCAQAQDIIENQLKNETAEFDESLKKNQELFQKINAKIQADPEITTYEEPLADMLHRLESEIKNQSAKKDPSKLHEEVLKDYNTAYAKYRNSLNENCNKLQRKSDQIWEENSNYRQKFQKLSNVDKEFYKNKKDQLNLLSKEQLEQLIKDKEKQQEDFKQLRKDEIPVRLEQKASIDAVTVPVMKEAKQSIKAFTAAKEQIIAAFTPEQLKERLTDATNTLNAFHDKYTAYFQDVEKRYEQVLQNRKSLNEVFEAAKDITKKSGFFSIQKKNPKIFTDTMDAVGTYISDRKDPEKAQKAYDACRKYVESYMKSDRSGLKSGNADGNTRRQTVVRMLELMDQLPEFKKFTVSDSKNKNGWEVVDKEDTAKYTKLNYKQLEASLAKHATKPKQSKKQAKAPQKASAFYDIDKLVNKRKEQQGKGL